MEDLITQIYNSESQIFINGRQLPQSSTSEILILKEVKKVDENTFISKTIVTNKATQPFNLYSIKIADFKVNKKVVKSVLQNGWVQSSPCQYLNGVIPTSKKTLFLKRDQNPYSFHKEYGYIENSLVSEWFVILNFESYSLLIGAITINKSFSQVFIKENTEDLLIRVTSQLDGVQMAFDSCRESDEIVFIYGEEYEIKEKFANILKEKNNVSLKSSIKPLRGVCCAYYAQSNNYDDKYIYKTIESLKEYEAKYSEKLVDYVQLDAGYCKWGDWLNINNIKFKTSLESISQYITNSGYLPGIWISPFVASSASELFKGHPEWFIRKEDGRFLESRQTSPADVLPPLGLFVLDITKTEVQMFIYKTIKKFVNLGFKLIKIDFLYPSCFAEKYSKNVTRAQAIRMGLETIREAAGEETIILSAISHLSPLVGLVDYVRTGIDSTNPLFYKIPIISSIVNEVMIKKDLDNYINREFFDGKIWYADSDCIVLNKQSGLSKKSIQKHINILKRSSAKWFGDDLSKINIEKLNEIANKIN